MTITIIGTILCFRVNKEGDNKDFIGRIICLGWPICVKLLAPWSVLLGVFFVISHSLNVDLGAAFAVVSIFFEICYYYMLYKYVNIVAQSHVVKELEF